MADQTSNNNADTNDPLVHLPSEIVLRIIDNATLASVAKLTQLTRAWHDFIDQVHQDAIYSSPSKVERPVQTRNFSFIDSSHDHNKYYNEYYDNIQSWKDLCRRQTLLKRGWNRKRPITREANIQVGHAPIWRFRPDFKRRIFLSTSQIGGLNVTDMDSGRILFQLKADTVRPFAHLEYEDGTAVFDREGDAVEVWKTDLDFPRGEFKRVAILNHDRQTRGFQLRNKTLCVVSSEEKGYVYDLSGEPTLLREIDIENGAVGHLDQGRRVVAYSLGDQGYHFYDKQTGEALGILHPEKTTNAYHVAHPKHKLDCRIGVGSVGRASDTYPPQYPSNDRTTQLYVKEGKLPQRTGVPRVALRDDEWGAGMLDGDLFAGVSRGGRVFICSNWRKALTSASSFQEVTANLECDTDGSTFDLGGWLAVRGHKLMFENRDRAYIIGLNDDDTLKTHDDSPQRPSYAYATSSAAQLAVPVSFMGIYDDCVMSTYTALRMGVRIEVEQGGIPQERHRILPTKVIRVLSFAPDLGNPNGDETVENAAVRSEGAPLAVPEVGTMRSDLIQLIAMLEGEPELENDIPVAVDQELADDLGLEEWLEEDEWEYEDENNDEEDTASALEEVDWP